MGSTHRTGRAGTVHVHPAIAQRRSPSVRRAAVFVALAALGIAACGNDDDSGGTAALDAPTEFAAEDGALVVTTDAPADVPDASAGDAPATGSTEQTGAPIDLTFGRDLIVEAGVTMLTSDVRQAVDDVIDIVGRNGGAIFRADVTVDDPLEDGSVPGSGTIVIRIPPAQLDLLVGDLRGVGTLRNQTQSVDDVTDRLIDLDIQIRQAFESVERMEAILAGTTDFDSLVAAETELVRRQTAYERLLAAQRTIDDRVALSTLTVQVEYRPLAVDDEPVVDEGDKGIGDAFSDGWEAFVGVLFAVAFVLAVATPFLTIALLVALAAWLIGRRTRRRGHLTRNRNEPFDEPAKTTVGTVDETADSAVSDEANDLVDANPTE